MPIVIATYSQCSPFAIPSFLPWLGEMKQRLPYHLQISDRTHLKAISRILVTIVKGLLTRE
jgi:hypothetical protein